MSPQTTIWTTAAIFAVTYGGLALGKIPRLRLDRAGIAFVGAAAMLATGMLTLAQATAPESIDYPTILLLFSMMVVVGLLRLSGVFVQLGHWAFDRIATPRALLLVTIALSGLLSAFLVNDIVCLALTPVVIHLARRLRFDPLPHLIGLATAANIGSAGTITGNPQNMIIGMASQIGYARFIASLFPLSMLGLTVDFLIIAWVYRGRLAGGASDAYGAADEPIPRPTHDRGAHRRLRQKAVIVTVLTVILFMAGLPIALVAMCAAAVLMLIARLNPERIYLQIDWSLLVMFAGLFIVVHAFEMNVVSTWGFQRWGMLADHPVVALSVLSAGLSNLVSNVPAVLLFEPVLRALPAAEQQRAWLALAMSSTFAGNLTVLGSVANLIVVEKARQHGVAIGFREYCRAGIPVTLVTIGMGILWLTAVFPR